MRNIFLLACTLLTVSFIGCTDSDEELLSGEVSSGVEMKPDNKPNNVIDSTLFQVINLDYPGLEKVKEHYNKKEYYYAAYELLTYYRHRITVNNPHINLINPTLTAKEQHIAEQALDYRFYVKGFAEKVDHATKEETYYRFYDNSKKTIDWNANANIQQKEQEFRYQLHRHQWMLPQAKAYRITRNEQYVLSWIETYKSWLETFPYERGTQFPPEGGSNNDIDYQWKGLQVVERVLAQADMLPYFIHSINFTPEWLSTFLSAFEKEVECIRLNYYQSGNILISQYQAIATAGILMPEFKKAKEWADEGTQGMGASLDKQFNEDGVEYELDLSYHIAAISDFREIYLLAQANNCINLLPDNYISKLKKATEFVMDMIYPNYTIDNFNDTRSDSYPKSTLLNRLKEYATMYPDDLGLLWMATEGKSGSRPTYTNKVYDTSGYYMLRNGWTPSATMMILKNNYNPSKEWHCQPDNGTFGLYHNGRNFFPDAGVYTYNTGKDRDLFAGTVNHNTMTIMSKTIGKEEGGVMAGELLWNIAKGNTNILVTENQQSKTIKHRRSVFFVDRKFFVLVDEGYSATPDKGSKTNINFHLVSDKDTPTTFVKEKQNSTQKHPYYLAYTNFEHNNLLTATFTETEQDLSGDLIKPDKATNVVSTNTGQKNGPLRVGYQISLRQPTKSKLKAPFSATRYITVLYPFDTAADRNKIKVDAYFTDNTADNAGAFHPEGATIQVTINEKVYNLSSHQ